MIGEKLKHMDSKYPEHKPLFDDDYFSEMIVSQEEDLDFFGNSIVQNIIDYQFEKCTRTYMQSVFGLYFFGFVCPYLILLTTDNPAVTVNVFKICLLP